MRRTVKILLVLGVVFSVLVSLTPARADNSDLSLDPDETVNVVYAVYGGIANAQAHYVNVTDKVTELLKNPQGFPVTPDAILNVHSPKEFQSLIIVFNYQDRRYFYNLPEGGGTVSLDTLKKQAKMHPSHYNAIPSPGKPDSDFRVVFAIYGVSDLFWNVTDLVKKLIVKPDGFFAHEDIMGGDPHFGDQKAIVIIFNDASGRHFYAQVNNGPQINKEVLANASTSN